MVRRAPNPLSNHHLQPVVRYLACFSPSHHQPLALRSGYYRPRYGLLVVAQAVATLGSLYTLG